MLVDELDVAGLARAIGDVCDSAPLRERLGIESRRIAEARFSARNAEQKAALLHAVVRASAVGARQPEACAQ